MPKKHNLIYFYIMFFIKVGVLYHFLRIRFGIVKTFTVKTTLNVVMKRFLLMNFHTLITHSI